jgi:Family of unknown function (DUF5990)
MVVNVPSLSLNVTERNYPECSFAAKGITKPEILGNPDLTPGSESVPDTIAADTGVMRIRIEAFDLPGSRCGPSPDVPGGYDGIMVAVQRRNKPAELIGLTPGDAPSAVWDLDCAVTRTETGTDVRGPFIQGPPGARFVYLSWVYSDGSKAPSQPDPSGGTGGSGLTLFRRAKLRLDAVPAAVMDAATERGTLIGRLRLTDDKGHPLCASVRPPLIEWRTEKRGSEKR